MIFKSGKTWLGLQELPDMDKVIIITAPECRCKIEKLLVPNSSTPNADPWRLMTMDGRCVKLHERHHVRLLGTRSLPKMPLAEIHCT